MLAAIAAGNLTSGLLAELDLRLPFLVAGVILMSMFGIVLSLKEPQQENDHQPKKSYGTILREAAALMRSRPPLRYAVLYLVVAPLTAVIMETVFLQPQALAWGVSLAGVGAVVMVVQLIKVAGSAWAHQIKQILGESLTLYSAPVLIVLGLSFLAAFQQLPALLFVAAIGFVTAVLRPVVLHRIQQEVPNDIRATVLSLQALLFTILAAIVEPLLGVVADRAGLPAAYLALAGGLSILFLLLWWRGRAYFPQAALPIEPQQHVGQ